MAAGSVYATTRLTISSRVARRIQRFAASRAWSQRRYSENAARRTGRPDA